MFRVTGEVPNAHSDSAWAVSWTPDGRIATGSVDGTAKLWAYKTSEDGDGEGQSAKLELLRALTDHDLGIISCVVSVDGKLLITSAMDSVIRIFSLDTLEIVHSIDAGPVEAWTLAVQQDAGAPLLAAGTQAGNVNLWRLRPDGGPAAGGGAGDGGAGADDGAEGGTDPSAPSGVMEGRGKFTMSVAFSPVSSMVASGHRDGVVNVFDMSESTSKRLTPHAAPVRALAFSRDGKTLLSGGDDGQIKAFDVIGGEELFTLTGHVGWVCALAVDHAGKLFASASTDGSVKIWSLATRECEHTFAGAHAGQCWDLSFHPSAGLLASVGDDGKVQTYVVRSETG